MRWWGGQAKFVEKMAADVHVGEENTTLERHIPLLKAGGKAAEATVKCIPVLLYALWAQGKVIAKYPKWNHRIMDAQTELSDPSRDWSGRHRGT